MNISEHQVVVLTREIPEHNLRIGDIGTVVHIYANNQGYEVEFMTGSGKTITVKTLEPKEIRPLGDNEILHGRTIAAES